MSRFQNALRAALVSGTAASLSSAVALVICSRIEEGRGAGALNGPSQWLWGEREARKKQATLRHTAAGYLIHHASSLFWATLYEFTCRRPARKSIARHAAETAMASTAAYVVDYYLTPRRFRPGFRKHLGSRSIFAAYAAFAAGLAAVAIMRDGRRAILNRDAAAAGRH